MSGAACASAAALGAYNVDPNSISLSGLSSGGFMSAQLGVAYSDTFKAGFGVFAGDRTIALAASRQYTTCMYNQNPSITGPIANMKTWSGNKINPVSNLQSRRIYMWTGTADTTVGPNVMSQLKAQLANFDATDNVSYITTSGAVHTFPTDFDASGDNSCSSSGSPYISNCQYDGAGAVLKWMYGTLNARNTGTLSGSIVSFSQTGEYGASGMDTTGYLYVPKACQSGSSTVCKLHVALHGCLQSYSMIGSKFISNTGYNMWADTNNIIILYPQAVADSSMHTIWTGMQLPNPNGCWDWVGWYGANADQVGGVQMAAIVNQVARIVSGYGAGSSSSTTTATPTTTTGSKTTTTTTTTTVTTTALAPLYGQCGGIGWTGQRLVPPVFARPIALIMHNVS
ncbi:putative polyhydroxybutyrate depolymerase [Aspergillus novofumigatus IBT 16806]|uniref:Fungal cellulose binding domain protein n=1 Tax=Aspergillus novofumigatus (strain IBT 16806) TaxID=1392255 RepID=A0A2I1C6V5_ASPN1|nr:fungal cellulose binding domain protein [Aspergillus novofumigatus IBT 16806]PKX93372.1 fungal cellulose binding domain protein [Aspergillus novofumigatus IBT 16806]